MMETRVDLNLPHLLIERGSKDFDTLVEEIIHDTNQTQEFPKNLYSACTVRSHNRRPTEWRRWVELHHVAGAVSAYEPHSFDANAEKKIRLQIHRLQMQLNRGMYKPAYTLKLGNSTWNISETEYDYFQSLNDVEEFDGED